MHEYVTIDFETIYIKRETTVRVHNNRFSIKFNSKLIINNSTFEQPTGRSRVKSLSRSCVWCGKNSSYRISDVYLRILNEND